MIPKLQNHNTVFQSLESTFGIDKNMDGFYQDGNIHHHPSEGKTSKTFLLHPLNQKIYMNMDISLLIPPYHSIHIQEKNLVTPQRMPFLHIN